MATHEDMVCRHGEGTYVTATGLACARCGEMLCRHDESDDDDRPNERLDGVVGIPNQEKPCGSKIETVIYNAQAHQTLKRSVGGMVPPVVGNSGSEEVR